MSPNRPCVCAGCRVVHLRAALNVWESEDGSPSPMDGRLVCDDCWSELVSDDHSNTREGCDCRHCEAAFKRYSGVVRDNEAMTHGGFRPGVLALLGLTALLDDLNLTVAPEPKE